ncbi:unnamed protein product [Peronospora belbahrii]|uniref:Uncharacterized protein n=1 Tax=Peronospora belbahrii TaxID=622444 RepID=A0ABN8D949_9STRA|nr:unnamed protein product [Peronospora belbahrii]
MTFARPSFFTCFLAYVALFLAVGLVEVAGKPKFIDEDVGKNIVEIVQARGFDVQTHKSLAFLLADAGYDVWLANNRGTTWSREHVTYTDDDDEFWDFTWEDMEETTVAFAGFSFDQELAKQVSYFAALAPVAWTGHLTARIFKTMAVTHLDKLYQILGIREFTTKNKFIQELVGGFACTIADDLCTSAITMVVGSSVNTNVSRIAVYISQTPAGTSVKNMAHYAQNIRDNTFASYDYGCKCKRKKGLDKCSESK